MNLWELRGKFEMHLDNISDEQFEIELIDAGINNYSNVQDVHELNKMDEIMIVVPVYERKALWGCSIYSQPSKGIRIEGYDKEVA